METDAKLKIIKKTFKKKHLLISITLGVRVWNSNFLVEIMSYLVKVSLVFFLKVRYAQFNSKYIDLGE